MTNTLSPTRASELTRMTLGHVQREYPHSESVRLNSDADLAAPRCNHPVFFGSYDWHSCVHSYWLLARLLACFPGGDAADDVVALFDQQLTAAKVERELEWFRAPGRGGFERPYGWAWLLRLQGALHELDHPRAALWGRNLQPLADFIAGQFVEYLPKLGFSVRAGAHSNTAFAMLFAHDYAVETGHAALREMVAQRAEAFYLSDAGYHGWEPGGEDFLSPGWQQALLLQRVLGRGDFLEWFADFLPELAEGRPASLFMPVEPADRTDGRLAHLDGLNLSRAWCLRELSLSLDEFDSRRAVLQSTAQRHLQAGSAHLRDDYMGEHWLASFLLLALGY
ncbi:DUF2891 domain-containing protein [Pseudomonas saliphila]|uniref:DUF2891 domain-containing protein n=1 Tax=Pseudomonas saliphila TaxID=2586906 RepID=UPI0012397FE8|nr:DUF2891 domain-containing protein [Pseudomonas saliphila]